jgi:hypothetical protein
MKTQILFFTILFSVVSFGQIKKGIVKDSIGNIIENVYITNIVSNTHAHTNELGSFIIDKTNIGDVLKIAALGYKKTNFTVDKEDFIIVLEDESYQLEQVVIQSKLNALSAISKIDLQTNPVNSSQEILRKVPGLFIGNMLVEEKPSRFFCVVLTLITEQI